MIQVYVVAPLRAPNSEENNNEAILERLSQIPEVVFVPEVWTKTEIGAWQAMKPNTQLWTIGARSGWLEEHMPVLPFAFILPDTIHRRRISPAGRHLDVVATLGATNVLTICGVDIPAASVVDLIDKLEDAYWGDAGVKKVFLGALLNEFVAADD